MSPFRSRVSCVGFDIGSRAAFIPAPGRNGETAGTSPTSPGIIGIPVGMGIGIGIAISAGAAFDESAAFLPGASIPGMPGIPGIGAGFRAGAGGGEGGLCCAGKGAPEAQPSRSVSSDFRTGLTVGCRETVDARGTTAAIRSATFRAAPSAPCASEAWRSARR